MSKIAVFGGAGFIGSNLVDRLIEMSPDNEVYVIDDLSSGKIENVNPKAKFINFDITNNLTEWNFPEVDYIFHLAAIPRVPFSVENPVLTHKVNVDGTLNVLQWARLNKVKKVIFASSSSVYGDAKLPLREDFSEKTPKSPYAMQKLIGEQLMRLYDELYGLPTISLRFFNVYGPRCDPNSEYSLVIGKFLKQKSENKPLTIFGDGEQSRDFTHVSDIVAGCIVAMEKEVHNEVINLCNGKSITIIQVAFLLGGNIQYLPKRIGDVLHTKGSTIKSKKLLGWQGKVKINEGIEELKLRGGV